MTFRIDIYYHRYLDITIAQYINVTIFILKT